MEWTEEEIARHYRQAKNKNEAVLIEMQCNVCSRSEVLNVLSKYGIQHKDNEELTKRPQRMEKIWLCRTNGLTYTTTELCREFDVDRMRVMTDLKKYGKFRCSYNNFEFIVIDNARNWTRFRCRQTGEILTSDELQKEYGIDDHDIKRMARLGSGFRCKSNGLKYEIVKGETK